MSKANITKSEFIFPPTKKVSTVETGFMREVMNRTMAIHPGNVVWYGESRIGKTTTAKHFVNRINKNYTPENHDSFRAVHFEAGEIASWTGNEQKKGLKSLYNATVGRIDEGSYRTDPTETIAETLVYALKRKNIQKVFIDEAGNLSLDAIRGIMMAFDAAKSIDHNLSLIFIGMDDLPTKMTKLPQINGRLSEWCYFEKYTLEEIATFLKELHSYFAEVDLKKAKSLELVECVYEEIVK
jgi:Cdc6-like AAA superfamily ATPase